MSDKVINTFQQRRQLSVAVKNLGETESEIELQAQVRAIANAYSADQILTVLRRFLDTDSSQLRGGLGRLSTLLPYDETVAILRAEAANRNNPTQARLTAALILERFLQAEISPALMGDLKNPEVVVLQSLQEALDEGIENRYILLEYVRQMRLEDESVAFMVLDLLGRQPPFEQVELLRLIAYDQRTGVAKRSLSQLADLRGTPAETSAAAALYSLVPNLHPDLSDLAERSLRKMRFAGLQFEPDEAKGWRALITPSDLFGTQALWFLVTEQEEGSGILIGNRINVMQGLLETFGSEAVEQQYLPPARAVGEMVNISLSHGAPTVFLEVPFAYAQMRLKESLNRHARSTPFHPLPEEYTLYNVHIFRHRPPEVDPELLAFLDSGADLFAHQKDQLEEASSVLLRHPAMAGWFLHDRAILSQLEPDQNLARHNIAKLVDTLLSSILARTPITEFRNQLKSALISQAGWLAIAGHRRHAEYALLLSESLEATSLQNHPLIIQMTEIGVSLLLNRRPVQR